MNAKRNLLPVSRTEGFVLIYIDIHDPDVEIPCVQSGGSIRIGIRSDNKPDANYPRPGMRADDRAQIALVDLRISQYGFEGVNDALHLDVGIGIAKGYTKAKVRLGRLEVLKQGSDDVFFAADTGDGIHLAMLDLHHGLDTQKRADKRGGAGEAAAHF